MQRLRHPFAKGYFWSIWYMKQVAGKNSILFPPQRPLYRNIQRETLFKRLESKRRDRYKGSKRTCRINLWMLGRHDRGCRQHVISGFKWKRRL